MKWWFSITHKKLSVIFQGGNNIGSPFGCCSPWEGMTERGSILVCAPKLLEYGWALHDSSPPPPLENIEKWEFSIPNPQICILERAFLWNVWYICLKLLNCQKMTVWKAIQHLEEFSRTLGMIEVYGKCATSTRCLSVPNQKVTPVLQSKATESTLWSLPFLPSFPPHHGCQVRLGWQNKVNKKITIIL